MTLDLSRRNFLKLVTVLAAASAVPEPLVAEVEAKVRSIRFRQAIRLWEDGRIVRTFDMLERDLDFELEIQNDFVEIDRMSIRNPPIRGIIARRHINLRIGEQHFIVQDVEYSREVDDPDEWFYIDIKQFTAYDPERDRLLWAVGSEFPMVIPIRE